MRRPWNASTRPISPGIGAGPGWRKSNSSWSGSGRTSPRWPASSAILDRAFHSGSRRRNLRQLESTLKSRQPTSGEPFGSTDPEFQQVQTVQGRLIEEATKALSAAKDFDGDGVSVEKSELGNREYIESQNEAVITNNQLDLPALRDKSSENLNFYDEKDSRRSKSLKGNFEDGVRLDNADRLQLKEQLAKQAPIVKAAPSKSDFAYQHGGIGGAKGQWRGAGRGFQYLAQTRRPKCDFDRSGSSDLVHSLVGGRRTLRPHDPARRRSGTLLFQGGRQSAAYVVDSTEADVGFVAGGPVVPGHAGTRTVGSAANGAQVRRQLA